MGSVGFSAEKYIEEQSKYILERIQAGDGRLYLEFGGKLVQDKHAMRVLPGFDENAKIKLLNRMKDQTEINHLHICRGHNFQQDETGFRDYVRSRGNEAHRCFPQL